MFHLKLIQIINSQEENRKTPSGDEIFSMTARDWNTYTIFVEKLVPSSLFQITSRALSADDVFFLTVSGVILLHERRHHGVGINYSHYGDGICNGPGLSSSYSARGPFASKKTNFDRNLPRWFFPCRGFHEPPDRLSLLKMIPAHQADRGGFSKFRKIWGKNSPYFPIFPQIETRQAS